MSHRALRPFCVTNDTLRGLKALPTNSPRRRLEKTQGNRLKVNNKIENNKRNKKKKVGVVGQSSNSRRYGGRHLPSGTLTIPNLG